MMHPESEPSAGVYRRLSFEPEFRLIILLPSTTFDSQIECRLEHAVLGACKPYEALSYMWGSTGFTKHIILDSQPFMITPNLECALRYLRRINEERTLWIDALCINQEDLAERREQVGYMRQIYSNCSSDIFWLGPEDDDYLRGMEIIRKLQGFNIEQIESLGWWSRSVSEKYSEENTRIRINEASDIDQGKYAGNSTDASSSNEKKLGQKYKRWTLSRSDTTAIRNLLSHAPIWRRVWIMQEISCSPNVILTCGHETLNWRLVDAILNGGRYYTDAFHAHFPHDSPRSWTVLFGTARTITTQRETVAKGRMPSESSLLDVLARFKDTDSTDPRDKVYGLLGLVSDTLGVEADYTRSVQETYTTVALAIINSAANLDLLCQSPWRRPTVDQYGRPLKRLDDLPYWVPSFESREDGEFLFAQRNIFASGRPLCPVPCVVEGSNTLLARGFLLGRLKAKEATGLDKLSIYAEDDECQEAILELGSKILLSLPEHTSTYRTGENRLQAFWRTLVADCKGYPMARLTLEDISHDQRIFQELFAQGAPIESFTDLRSYKMLEKLTKTKGWRFYTTENDIFVLAQRDSRAGDVLAILDGAKLPMVLRPTTGESDGQVLYQPLNGAYVHGFMDGEVLKCEDEFKEQVFRLV